MDGGKSGERGSASQSSLTPSPCPPTAQRESELEVLQVLQCSSEVSEAGEVLLVALPIAQASANGPALVEALKQRCRVSGRARRRLRCLADGGGAGRALSPEELAQALYPMPDEVPEPLPEGQAPEGDLQLQEILNHNVLAPSTLQVGGS
ncbi:unnamed protein product [Symbiodinium natans]|uniref:Uncharacterized protein n=1 Tax=Symbiodinium natans TaxID=878477 RepID=A0A812LP71_9DINO|nr:unnamed protein product [Symbiodinium natans]